MARDPFHMVIYPPYGHGLWVCQERCVGIDGKMTALNLSVLPIDRKEGSLAREKQPIAI